MKKQKPKAKRTPKLCILKAVVSFRFTAEAKKAWHREILIRLLTNWGAKDIKILRLR